MARLTEIEKHVHVYVKQVAVIVDGELTYDKRRVAVECACGRATVDDIDTVAAGNYICTRCGRTLYPTAFKEDVSRRENG